MNKFIARILSFVLSAACMLTCVSCAGGSSKAKLSVYLMDMNRYMITQVDKLSDRSDAPEVEMKIFLDEDADKFASEVISGASSGEGPDIIVFSPDEYDDLKSLIQEGLLCDINELIKKDKSFKLSDYNEKVMDSGIVNENRYFLPISYCIPTLSTTKEILDENGMNLEGDAWDWSNLSEFAKKGLDNATYIFDSRFGFMDLMENCGLDLYNTIEETSKFESREFIELLEMYEKLSKSICPANEEQVKNDLCRQSNLLKNNTTVLVSTNSGDLDYIYLPYLAFQSEVDPVIYPMPSYKNVSHITVRPVQMVAISNKCKNKAAAFKYIKLLLSEEFQVGGSITFCPVNNSAYEKKKSECVKYIRDTVSSGVQSEESLNKLVDSIEGIIKRIEKCIVPDYSIESIVKAQLQDFLNGSKTAAETAALIQSEVQTYFKEGSIAAVPASASSTESVEKKPPLKMYIINYDGYLSTAVSKYNSTYDDINIEISSCSSDEYKNKIATELASGGGPDIIRTDPYTVSSIHKVMSNGAFCDLNELISNDKSFDLSDYNENILKAGIYKGKRYIMPICYGYNAFYTTQKVLDDNQIDLNFENWDWESIAVLVKKFMKDNEGKQKYFFAWNFGFDFILSSYGKSFVDFDKKESSFCSDEFISLLNMYKEIYPSVCPHEITQKYYDAYSMLSNNIAVIVNQILANPYDLSMKIDNIKDFRVYPYPVYDGKKQIYVQPYISLAINEKCKYKKEAWNYIKIALDSERLEQYGHGGFAPVSKKHFESLKSNLLKSDKNLCDLIDNAECNDIFDGDIDIIIVNELTDFLNGKKTAEQTAKIINDKVSLYLNE